MTAFQESGSTAEILVWAQQAKTALEGSAQKVRNDQQLKLSWSAFDHSTQSSLTASSTAQLIKDLSTTQHVTFDTSLFKGADLDALVDYKALLALDKRYLTEPNTSPVADDHCVGQFYKSDQATTALLIFNNKKIFLKTIFFQVNLLFLCYCRRVRVGPRTQRSFFEKMREKRSKG
jgi:hypothetical protein